jgi:hypothetical protein
LKSLLQGAPAVAAGPEPHVRSGPLQHGDAETGEGEVGYLCKKVLLSSSGGKPLWRSKGVTHDFDMVPSMFLVKSPDLDGELTWES